MDVNFDHEPFSRAGSYLALAWETPSSAFAAPLGDGWYIRSHHARAVIKREIFRLSGLAMAPGAVTERVELQGGADASEARLAGGGGLVRICFAEDGGLRIRGERIGLRLEVPIGPGVVAYAETHDRITVNAREATRRYGLHCLSGEIRLRTSWRGVTAGDIAVDLVPGEDGIFECAVDEYWSTWSVPNHRPGYREVVRSAQADFARFLHGYGRPPADPELASAWERAAYICWSAIVHPEGLLARPTMFMSKNWMDQVWSWDNCFNAQALAAGNPELAWDQWFVVFDHQDEFGAIPDGLNDVFRHYNFCKPPVHGWTMTELLARSSYRPPEEDLARAYRHLAAHTRWFLDYRRRPGDILPYYLHGNDSGWDNATMFDDGVPLVAPDLAALLIAQCDALADLGAELSIAANDPSGGPDFWKEQADALFAGLLATWNGERFVPRRIADGDLQPVQTSSLVPIVPIFLGRRLPSAIRSTLVASLERHLTPYGLATEPPASPRYEPNGYWRGPIWAPSTYLIVVGLERCGEHELARTIADRFCRMCARSGFAENFDALTGAGLCDRAYTWTASVFLLLAR